MHTNAGTNIYFVCRAFFVIEDNSLPKVILKGFIIVPFEDLSAVHTELPFHIESTKKEKGCLIFQVLQDQAQSNKFNVHEEFIDKESFESHQDRVKSSKWGRVTSNIERHYHVNKIG